MPFWKPSWPRTLRILIRSRTLTLPVRSTSAMLVMQTEPSGHRVSLVGQMVHVPPVLSGHTVNDLETMHKVARAGQDVMVFGQVVAISGQTVKVAVASAQIVTSPEHRVWVAGQLVRMRGQAVADSGQIVAESIMLTQ